MKNISKKEAIDEGGMYLEFCSPKSAKNPRSLGSEHVYSVKKGPTSGFQCVLASPMTFLVTGFTIWKRQIVLSLLIGCCFAFACCSYISQLDKAVLHMRLFGERG